MRLTTGLTTGRERGSSPMAGLPGGTVAVLLLAGIAVSVFPTAVVNNAAVFIAGVMISRAVDEREEFHWWPRNGDYVQVAEWSGLLYLLPCEEAPIIAVPPSTVQSSTLLTTVNRASSPSLASLLTGVPTEFGYRSPC